MIALYATTVQGTDIFRLSIKRDNCLLIRLYMQMAAQAPFLFYAVDRKPTINGVPIALRTECPVQFGAGVSDDGRLLLKPKGTRTIIETLELPLLRLEPVELFFL